MSDSPVSADLLAIYLEDARAHLEALDHCLLTLERDGFDAEAVASVLGPLHTLKGNSGMIGFSGIKNYVHRLEDVFARIAERALPLTPERFDRLFAGASVLRDAVERAARDGAEARDLAMERAELAAMAAAATPAPVPAPPAGAPHAGAVRSVPTAPAPADPPADTRRTENAFVSTRSNMVRVDFGQLDHLLNLVGELIIYRTKLHDLGRELAERLGDRTHGGDLLEAVHQVAAVSTQLQETVMDIRMLPIRHVFERFPRLVRDLARQQGKEIELILEGETTRIDKAIIDEIGEPLVHMIRNAVDHGIEAPDQRVARGKTPTGTILLSATQESNHVLITIMDDGSGIDASLVREKALARGLLRGDEQLSERELVQLVFAQGFSTSDTVSEISGRGVGLDVVLKSIERLNGLVEVETVPGVGTKFIIQLPLTLAIISALLVEVAGRTYAIPLGSVVESLKLRPHELHRIGGREALRIRERIVPVVRLAELFALADGAASPRQYVVILGRGDKRVGLIVDHLKGQQQVVIKALDPSVSGAGLGLAGATIMGDGRVVLILDVTSLFEGRRHALGHGLHELPAAAAPYVKQEAG